MKTKITAAREAAASMHSAEEAVAGALEASRTALTQMRSARLALEMQSPAAAAAIARWQEAVTALDAVEQAMTEAHRAAYQALLDTKLRGIAVWVPETTLQ